jgi:hypothetical protein
MNTYGIDVMGRRRRRRHSAEFKAAVIRECQSPGVSMAAVALAHGLNANMLRKWVTDAEQQAALQTTVQPQPTPASSATPALPPSPKFVPLALPAAAGGEIHIELQRGGSTVKIAWPASAARDCAAWLSDWLR